MRRKEYVRIDGVVNLCLIIDISERPIALYYKR